MEIRHYLRSLRVHNNRLQAEELRVCLNVKRWQVDLRLTC